METGTFEQLSSNEISSSLYAPRTFKAFFVCAAGNGFPAGMASTLWHLGEVTHVKVARTYRDITGFIKALEPETITLEQQHLCARGLDALLPILARKNIPVVFKLTKDRLDDGYLCIGIEISNVKGDYHGRLVPAMKTLFEKVW